MPTEYQYGIMVLPAEMKLSAMEFEALTDDQKARAITGPLGEMADRLSDGIAALPEQPTEVVSHDILIVGSSFFLTAMVRRPR